MVWSRYIENATDSTKKLLELINEFSKAAGYKINIQKSVAFLYTGDKTSEKENYPIHNSIRNNKILRNKFYQGSERSVQWKSQDMKETEEDIRNGKIVHVHGSKKLILLKCSQFPKSSIDSV